jgi:hypothetical protein
MLLMSQLGLIPLILSLVDWFGLRIFLIYIGFISAQSTSIQWGFRVTEQTLIGNQFCHSDICGSQLGVHGCPLHPTTAIQKQNKQTYVRQLFRLLAGLDDECNKCYFHSLRQFCKFYHNMLSLQTVPMSRQRRLLEEQPCRKLCFLM